MTRKCVDLIQEYPLLCFRGTFYIASLYNLARTHVAVRSDIRLQYRVMFSSCSWRRRGTLREPNQGQRVEWRNVDLSSAFVDRCKQTLTTTIGSLGQLPDCVHSNKTAIPTVISSSSQWHRQ